MAGSLPGKAEQGLTQPWFFEMAGKYAKKRKRWRTKEAAGTYLHRDLFESKAFMALKGVAPQLLVILMGKRYFTELNGKKTCTNADSLSFSYIEAKNKYGITQPRFTRGIDELMAKGFITIKHLGGAYKQDKTVYSLSEEWLFWRPGRVCAERLRDTCQRGFRKPRKQLEQDDDQNSHT